MATSKSPFKNNLELKTQIDSFLNTHRAIFAQEAKRTSSFFELAAYNDIVKFYENSGYSVKPLNLKNQAKSASKQFVYALSPSAKPENCSYFVAEKKYGAATIRFEIRHNLRIQSDHDQEIFVSPDYAIIEEGSIQSIRKKDFYNAKIDYSFVPAKKIKTFGETKHYAPGPELVLNFVGLVNELMPELMKATFPTKRPMHFGPALFVSGVGNTHLGKIRDSLGKRYRINIFLGLFAYPSQVYSAKNQVNIHKIGST